MAQIAPAQLAPCVPTAEHGRPSRARGPAELMVVHLGPFGFGVAWIVTVAIRAICIAYCIGAVFALLLLDSPSMAYYVDLLRPGAKTLLRPAAAIYALIAGAHVIQILRMLVTSVERNHLSLGGEGNLVRAPASRNAVVVFATNAWNELFSRYGFFGVASPYFEWRYIAREVVEIISQSVQALHSSALIGRLWVNHLYVAIVVINCVSTPIVQHFARQHKWSVALERVLCIAIDIVLDAGTAIALPFAILLPYARALDWAFGSFDVRLLYNDVWFINLINENRQIFPLSTLDFCFKIVAHASIYLSLGSVRSILRPRYPLHRISKQPSVRGPFKSILLARDTTRRMRLHALTPQKWYCRPLSGRMAAVLHASFIFWGIVIVGCHVVAFSIGHPNDRHQMDGCKQQLRPWLVTSSACSVYEYSCFSRGTDSMEVDGLDFLDANALTVLIIAHCSGLRVPSSIQALPHLLGIEIYNSTLLGWDETAAITAKFHPEITYAFLIRSNLSEIPRGLLHSDLPSSLMDIEISHTNLSSVPDDLDSKWRHVMTLYIEHSRFSVVPDSLMRLSLSDFSLIGNNITLLPDFSINSGNYFMLALAKNPIMTLPPSLGALKGMNFVNLADTKLAVLPDWMETFSASATQVFLTNTPFCNAKTASEIDKDFGFNAKLSCAFTDFRILSRYPLAITAPLMAV